MREIVDKHFPDNWVISLYMGMTVNLCEAWEPYKAAMAALNNTLSPENVALQAQRHITKMPKLNKVILQYLKEGVLVEETVLDSIAKLLDVMREANVTIRWLMLHTRAVGVTASKQARAVAEELGKHGFNAELLFNLLLNTAQYEFVLKEMFNAMLAAKETKWTSLKAEASNRMSELGDVFGGVTPLTRVEKNDKLKGREKRRTVAARSARSVHFSPHPSPRAPSLTPTFPLHQTTFWTHRIKFPRSTTRSRRRRVARLCS
jgi:WASH complex subunit strumpellin